MNILKIKQTRISSRSRSLLMLSVLCSLLVCPFVVQAQDFSLQWVYEAGKAAAVQITSQAVDASGNVYVTGNFLMDKMSFDNSPISLNPNADIGANKVFLIKYASDGSIVWAKSFESGFDASGGKITIDQQNDIYLSGNFGVSINFGNMTLTENYGNSNFIAKFDSSGNALWALSASFYPQFQVSQDGHVIMYGSFTQPTLILSNNFILTNSDNSGQSADLFIINLASDGSLQWAKSSGISGQNESIDHIEFGSNGEIYASGSYGASFPLDGNMLNGIGNTNTYNRDWFVAQYNTNGNINWAKYGGLTGSYGPDIKTDQNGHLYASGSFKQSTTTFDGQILNGNGTLGSDNYYWFVGKYDATGNLQWAKAGGSPVNTIQLIPNNSGDLSLIGTFYNSVTIGNTTLTGIGIGHANGIIDYDGFAARCDANGQVIWAKHFGPHLGGATSPMSAVINGQGILSLSGNYGNGTFAQVSDSTITFDGHSITSLGKNDIFLARYDQQGNVLMVKNIGNALYDGPVAPLAQGQDGSLYLYGQYSSSPLTVDTASVPFPVLQHSNFFLAKFGTPSSDTGTGIQAITGKNSVQVFPNPTSGIIHLQASESITAIRIINILGQEVYHKALAVPEKTYAFDLSKQPEGIYWIEIQSSGRIATEKILLK